MRPRAEPRVIPASPVYVRVTLPHQTGEHVLRIPSTFEATAIFREVDPAALGVLGKALSDVRSIGQLLTTVQAMGPEVLGAIGYLIGVAWRHVDIDLEVVSTKADPLGYGRAVLEELHEAGYTLHEQMLLGTVVLAEWTRRHAVIEEAEQKTGFFPQPPVA